VIGIKEAVQKAADYFTDLYPRRFTNVMVEEIEQTDGDWLITLGYDDVPDVFSQLAKKTTRRFKLFKIDGETGDVISMKIREVEHVE
jgi:hypothetical protein